jgi:hypothetical protein
MLTVTMQCLGASTLPESLTSHEKAGFAKISQAAQLRTRRQRQDVGE